MTVNPKVISDGMRALADLLDGASPAETARAFAALLLDLAPVDELKGYLDEEARKRVDAIADAAEAAKVGD